MMNLLDSLSASGEKYDTGLILSGGGTRGFAHAGILKALNEAEIYPDIISGVSAGAIVGALYADGYSPDEMLEIFSEEDGFFNYARINFPGRGLFRSVGLGEKLAGKLKAETFEELKIPLIISATNLNKGEVVYFNEGKIVEKVLASAAIPVLFEPEEIDGELHVDGGVLDNFPVTPLTGKCNKLVGISLNPIHPEEDFGNLFRIAERTFRLSVSSNISPKIDLCDMVFEPDELGSYGLLDTSRGKEVFELGYRVASEQLKDNS